MTQTQHIDIGRGNEDAKMRRRFRVSRLCHLVGFAIMVVVAEWLCSSFIVFATESGKMIEKDGQYVFVETMDPATRLLLERSLQQGIITQDEYNRVIQESEKRAYLLQPTFKA